nr:MAG TPA: hypothetical protein [Caudoviricetes sp.]
MSAFSKIEFSRGIVKPLFLRFLEYGSSPLSQTSHRFSK